jgi:hypothetical protein
VKILFLRDRGRARDTRSAQNRDIDASAAPAVSTPTRRFPPPTRRRTCVFLSNTMMIFYRAKTLRRSLQACQTERRSAEQIKRQ